VHYYVTRREPAVRRPARHPAVAALALDKPPLRIEGCAVAFAGILAQQLGFLTWLDAIEFRLPYINEIIEPVRMIERAFGEGETGIEPLRVTIARAHRARKRGRSGIRNPRRACMAKSLGVGNAAKNGLGAALFAEGRLSGPES